MSSDLTNSQDTDRALWAAGDYDAIAEHIWDAGAAIASAVPIEAGMRVLDVATGTGNVAIRAAAAGGEVVGLDVAPELFQAARRRAAEAGVEVEWVEGDAESLTFEDDSFDRVFSAFGTTYTTLHDQAANELVRVCKPGGEIVMANWTPNSFPARLASLLRRLEHESTRSAVDPSEWGTHGHVRRVLGGQLVLAIEPASVDLVYESVDAMLAHYEENFGPLVVARREVDPQLYDNLRRELRAWIEEHDTGEGETRVTASYLLVVGHKPVADLRPNV
jgi:2-polyprenyl-6-hydroxyphenyl methylase/3-demethylubiquinone-9 3-methyltransferase